jgi:hypothetical protein
MPEKHTLTINEKSKIMQNDVGTDACQKIKALLPISLNSRIVCQKDFPH